MEFYKMNLDHVNRLLYIYIYNSWIISNYIYSFNNSCPIFNSLLYMRINNNSDLILKSIYRCIYNF